MVALLCNMTVSLACKSTDPSKKRLEKTFESFFKLPHLEICNLFLEEEGCIARVWMPRQAYAGELNRHCFPASLLRQKED